MVTEILNEEFIRLSFELIIVYSYGLILSIIARKLNRPVFLVYLIGGILLSLLIGSRTNITFLIEILNGFTIDSRTGVLDNLNQIGLIFLLFLTGLDTHTNELKKYGKYSVWTSIFGVLIPFILVYTSFMILGVDLKVAVVIGAVVLATHINVSRDTFACIGRNHSGISRIVRGATIVDDIIGVVVMSILIILLGNQSMEQSWLVGVGKVLITFLVILILGFIIVKLDKIIKSRNFRVTHHHEIIMGTVIFIFILSFFASFFGVAAVIGSYFAGLILSMTRLKETLYNFIQPIVEIFIVPVFFISKGLAMDLIEFEKILFFGLLISVLTIIGKIIGAGLGAKLTGLNNRNAVKVGYAMIPIGMVANLIAGIAKDAGVIGYDELASIVIVTVITSVFGPIILKNSYKSKKRKEKCS